MTPRVCRSMNSGGSSRNSGCERKQDQKSDIIVEIEPVAVKSHKDLGSSGWNGWQSIVMKTEYERVWGGQC